MAVLKEKRLKEKPWYFTIEITEDGIRKRIKRRGFKRKKDAEDAYRKLKAEMEGGYDPKKGVVSYDTFMLDYLNDKKMNVRASTLGVYTSLIKGHILPALGKHRIDKITPRHIQNFYNDLFESASLSDENIQKCHTIINESLKKAEGWSMIPKNPAALVDRPKARKKEMLFWNEEQAHRFLEAAKSDRYYYAFLLALTTGMRQGEILGLRMKDVDFDRRTISVNQILSHDGKTFQTGTKTDSGSRLIGIDRYTAAELRKLYYRNLEEKMTDQQLYQDNGLLICTKLGTPVSPRNLNRSFMSIVKRAGAQQIRFHDMRHTHVVMLLKARENNKRIAERLGWSSVKMIDRYAHIMPGMQQETADLFGNVFYGSGAESGAEKQVN